MKIRAAILFATTLLLISNALCQAQIATEITEADRLAFAEHRQNLIEAVGSGLIVLPGSYAREDDSRFRQSNHFYYLTGVETPYSALVLNAETGEAVLFLPPARTGTSAIFNGPSIGPGPEAVSLYGIEDTRPIEELESYISSNNTGPIWTYLAPEELFAGDQGSARYARIKADQFAWADHQTREERVYQWLASLVPGAAIQDVTFTVDALRRVKSNWEINRMRHAVSITNQAFRAVLAAVEPGMTENEVEAILVKEFIAGGAFGQSFTTIAAGGENNLILHYVENNSPLEDGTLLLMDFGCDYQYYATDISRTIPVSGYFTEDQREIYAKCLEIQKKLIAMCKPGISLRDISIENRRLMEAAGYGDYYYHGPGHYLGMSVHDVGDNSAPLEAGCVITIEPGIYIAEKGFGIRIEDDVLITEAGAEVLSAAIPKEIDEIEQLMNQE